MKIRLKMFRIIVLSFCLLMTFASWAYAGLTDDLVLAAKERTRHAVTYDGRYLRIDYPGGDVPQNMGVCTDVIIRTYRQVGIDLQVEVHEDMKAHFDLYPRIWGLKQPDPNIDHRRVPNLQVFFRRKGQALDVSDRAEDYRPGDLVTWMLPGNLPHIGMVVDRKSRDGQRRLIVHNIGRGPKMEDGLFTFPITGHYRYPLAPGTTGRLAPGNSVVSGRR